MYKEFKFNALCLEFRKLQLNWLLSISGDNNNWVTSVGHNYTDDQFI